MGCVDGSGSKDVVKKMGRRSRIKKKKKKSCRARPGESATADKRSRNKIADADNCQRFYEAVSDVALSGNDPGSLSYNRARARATQERDKDFNSRNENCRSI